MYGRQWTWRTAVVAIGLAMGCGDTTTPEPAPAPAPVTPPPAPAPATQPAGPLPALIVSQAQFVDEGGKMKPGPARMTLYRTDGTNWWDEVIEDPESNVFHKGIAWRDGILTIGAMKAKLVYWTKGDSGWTPKTLWEKSWGGKFDRLRDLEIGDLDGDGKDEMAIATHDMGVVAVGDEQDDGTWKFQEFDQTPDTFVHEVEIGDVDGDGKLEFYVTPSERNKSSGVSQPGGVARYDYKDGTYVRSQVVHWDESHAKEILVADLDGTGGPELYVAKEGHVTKKGTETTLNDPATIVQLVPGDGGKWTEKPIASLPNEKQLRFLVPGDVTGDGKIDLVAAGMDSGLWVLQRGDDGVFTPQLVDAVSGGFEHATHVADLDGDGKLEIYAASENKRDRSISRFVWNGSTWVKTKVADIPERRITWNLQDAKL